KDNLTKLRWQRFPLLQLSTQSEARLYCASVLGGGYRVPTYRELLTLVDEEPHGEWNPDAGASTPRFIDPNAFPGTPEGPFLSISPGSVPPAFKVVEARRAGA